MSNYKMQKYNFFLNIYATLYKNYRKATVCGGSLPLRSGSCRLFRRTGARIFGFPQILLLLTATGGKDPPLPPLYNLYKNSLRSLRAWRLIKNKTAECAKSAEVFSRFCIRAI